MTLRRLSVIALLGVGSAVLAQAGTGAPKADAKAEDEDEAANDTPVAAYTKEANEALSAMRVSLQRGLDEVKKARQEQDALRLMCVNKPVTAMKGVLRAAEDANVDLQDSIANSRPAQSRREFRKIRSFKGRMDNLLSELQYCSGIDSSVSTTSVSMTIDEDFIAIDPYYGNPDFFFDPTDALADGTNGGLGEPDGPAVRPPPASGIL